MPDNPGRHGREKVGKAVMVKQIPNLLTCLRILGGFSLFFIAPMGTTFFVVYTLCAFTDALDGFLARKLDATSELGSKLDTISDVTLYGVAFVRLVPMLWPMLPMGIWYGAMAVVAARVLIYIYAGFKFRRFAPLHTYLNKICSAMIFLAPYVLLLLGEGVMRAYCWILLAEAVAATVDELVIHVTRRTYTTDVHTLLEARKKEE